MYCLLFLLSPTPTTTSFSSRWDFFFLLLLMLLPADVIDAYIGSPEDSQSPKSFNTAAELDAAAARGEIQKGDRVTVGGQTGTYQ